jgi:mono/diheme cytochrome c family protein
MSGADRHHLGPRRGLALGLAAALAMAAVPAAPPVVRRPAYRNELPAGAGRAIAERACLMCHSAMLVNQQAKDSTGWEKTITQMEKWGATLAPAERDSLRSYLVARLGPRAAKSR